jgi:signal peptidase I
MTDADGGAPGGVPLLDSELLAPMIERWAAAHGRSLSDAAVLTRRAVEGDAEARDAFGEPAVAVLDATGDAHAFLRAAVGAAPGPPARSAERDHVSRPVAARHVGRDVGSRRRRIASRVAQVVMRGVTTVVAAFLVFVAYGTYIDNRWYKIVEIRGVSMEPTIQNGDAIVLTRPPERVEVGMILTLEVEGRVVTHRVVAVHDDGTFVTKGDANTRADDFSGLDVRVVGEYQGRIPHLGAFLSL